MKQNHNQSVQVKITIKAKTLLQLLLNLTFWLTATCAFSLDFQLHPNNSPSLNAIMAQGEIQTGDTIKLAELISELPTKKNTAVYLASRGGSLIEGVELGLLFRRLGIKTIVEGGQICASACALAFLGGTDGKGKPWRSSSDNSQLGFHAFYSSGGEDMTSNEVQKVVGFILAYAQQVDAPIETLIFSFMTPSSDMYYLSQNEICGLGIKLWSNKTNKFICK